MSNLDTKWKLLADMMQNIVEFLEQNVADPPRELYDQLDELNAIADGVTNDSP